MATVPTQIRIDRDIKEQAGILFSRLGLDMSGAVNMFLHQCVLRGGIPFSIEMPHYPRWRKRGVSHAIPAFRVLIAWMI